MCCNVNIRIDEPCLPNGKQRIKTQILTQQRFERKADAYSKMTTRFQAVVFEAISRHRDSKSRELQALVDPGRKIFVAKFSRLQGGRGVGFDTTAFREAGKRLSGLKQQQSQFSFCPTFFLELNALGRCLFRLY